MASILSFDSGSMSALLTDKNSSYFDMKYPIIYKNQIPKSKELHSYFYTNAIDNALKNN